MKVTSVDVSLKTGVYRGDATITVATQGTGPVTVVVEWFLGGQRGSYSVADGTESFVVKAGSTVTVVKPHTFSRDRGCYGGVRVTTKPAAGNTSASDSEYLLRCQDVPR